MRAIAAHRAGRPTDRRSTMQGCRPMRTKALALLLAIALAFVHLMLIVVNLSSIG